METSLIALLQIIYENQDRLYVYEILNQARSTLNVPPAKLENLLKDMVRDGLLKNPESPQQVVYGSRLSITPSGLLLLEQAKIDTQRFDEQQRTISRLSQSIAAMQKNIDAMEKMMQTEQDARSQEDAKYFWLGILFSFIIAFTVEHGELLVNIFRAMFQL